MKGKDRDIEITVIAVVTMLTYAIQFTHCLAPAAILHEMWMDAQTGVYNNVPGRLLGIASGGFFFLLIGWYRRTYLLQRRGKGEKDGAG